MSNKRRGTLRELKVRDYLEDRDWFVTKAGGSLGAADLTCLRLGSTPMLVQVKSDKAGPFHGFVPAERAHLLKVAEMAGADAWLAHWPPHGKLRWYSPDEWPQAKVEAA